MTSKNQEKYPAQEPSMMQKVVDKLEKAGDVVQSKLEAAGHYLESEWNKHNFGPVLNNFVTGYRIQLVSRASHHTLQIVEGPSGQLTLDGKGEIGAHAWNAIWTVVNDGNNQVQLYNNNNFLAIVNGEPVVIQVGNGAQIGAETKFQLVLNGDYLVALQSTVGPERCIGINEDGSLKTAQICASSSVNSLFGVLLIKNPENAQLEDKK